MGEPSTGGAEGGERQGPDARHNHLCPPLAPSDVTMATSQGLCSFFILLNLVTFHSMVRSFPSRDFSLLPTSTKAFSREVDFCSDCRFFGQMFMPLGFSLQPASLFRSRVLLEDSCGCTHLLASPICSELQKLQAHISNRLRHFPLVLAWF